MYGGWAWVRWAKGDGDGDISNNVNNEIKLNIYTR